MNFADQLKQLPPIGHMAAIEMLGDDGTVVARIDNQPGKAES